jgi:hypothetical protein
MNVLHWIGPLPPQRRLRRNGWRKLVVKLTIVVVALAALMLPLQARGQETDASRSSSESVPVVELSIAEADSLLDLIDDQNLRIALLEIDLEEARRIAASDSTLAADRLRHQERSYEAIIEAYRDDRDNWLERMVKKPIVWLALGMWLGVQAQ